VADEREQGRHQGHRADHRGHDRHGRRVPERSDERDPGDRESEERDDDRRPGVHDRSSRRPDRARDRLAHLHPAANLVEMAHDEEERVVDPDAEADHGRERRRDARHLRHMAEQPDQAEPAGEPDDRDEDRHPHGDDRPEREGEDDHRGDDPDHLGRLGRRLGELRPDRPARRDLHPGLDAGLGSVEDCLRLFLGEIRGAQIHQHRDVRGLLVVRDQRRVVLRERIRRT
jgi:hypothetical protein